MPWSEADRAKYDVIRERYSSDLSESEFALIFPYSDPCLRRTPLRLSARSVRKTPPVVLDVGRRKPARKPTPAFPRLWPALAWSAQGAATSCRLANRLCGVSAMLPRASVTLRRAWRRSAMHP